MAVTLQVSDVRAQIYRSAGGPQSAGANAASTPLLGRIFHEAFAELVGTDERENFHGAIDEAETSLANWRTALINHTYERLIGPRLRLHHSELNFSPERVLNFWDAAQEMCGWLAELLWKANDCGAALNETLITAEEPLLWELRDEGWTDAVVLTGVADAVCRVPEKQGWCLIELKTGRTAPEADLAQACLYHQMLAASGLNSSGMLALVSFEPQKREQLFTATQLAGAQKRLRQLIGKLAAVLPENGPLPPIPDQYLELGQRLEKAFAEYKAEIKTGTPIVGPAFLRFPIELGRRVTINALRQRVGEAQARLELAAPPRVSLEDGRLAVDMQRLDRQTIYFSTIRQQLPQRDPQFGNSQVPVGVKLNADLLLTDFSQPENAHLLVAGTPGSGKSEWLRTAVAGLLVTNTPDTVRLALVDPKMNAFQLLRQSPFLYTDIAYDEQAATALLERLLIKMDARYTLMSQVNADNLTDYVRLTQKRMPRIFAVFDEYADLMMGERKKRQAMEAMVRRLGQKARAAGIHLILATQQPSSQVITGPIKAIITARVGLRMQSMESKMLLGESGTESLLGKGDLLYKCIGDPVRLQSPYLPPEELEQVFGSAAAS